MMNTFIKRIIGFGIIAGLSTPAWAGDLTIPNSFTADTPAVAAEVNANFNAVEQEVDDNNARINTNNSNIDANRDDINRNADSTNLNSDNITSLTNRQAAAANVTNSGLVDITITMTNIDSLTVGAPGPGFIIFNASGIMALRAHTNGARDDLGCYLADDASSSATPSSFLTLPPELPTSGIHAGTMAITRIVQVSSAGNITVYLNCRITNGGGGQDAFVQSYEVNAIYVPNSM